MFVATESWTEAILSPGVCLELEQIGNERRWPCVAMGAEGNIGSKYLDGRERVRERERKLVQL